MVNEVGVGTVDLDKVIRLTHLHTSVAAIESDLLVSTCFDNYWVVTVVVVKTRSAHISWLVGRIWGLTHFLVPSLRTTFVKSFNSCTIAFLVIDIIMNWLGLSGPPFITMPHLS